ncbi:hypothetical protein [Nostoc sp. CMAA1605]|uniref:hypothetical protein n=1 Tax=Nostoc sp. CMAA1605 TaxID=2055159 RepID=UPI001F3C411C|nr:hypothetical protein [Nostoc sp. CMAA1605]
MLSVESGKIGDWGLVTGDWGHFDKLSASLGTGYDLFSPLSSLSPLHPHTLTPLHPFF